MVLIPEEKVPAALEELNITMEEQIGTKLYVRYQGIYMLFSGESYERISNYTGLSQVTLVNYCRAYRAKGIVGLGREKTTRSPTIYNT